MPTAQAPQESLGTLGSVKVDGHALPACGAHALAAAAAAAATAASPDYFNVPACGAHGFAVAAAAGAAAAAPEPAAGALACCCICYIKKIWSALTTGRSPAQCKPSIVASHCIHTNTHTGCSNRIGVTACAARSHACVSLAACFGRSQCSVSCMAAHIALLRLQMFLPKTKDCHTAARTPWLLTACIAGDSAAGQRRWPGHTSDLAQPAGQRPLKEYLKSVCCAEWLCYHVADSVALQGAVLQGSADSLAAQLAWLRLQGADPFTNVPAPEGPSPRASAMEQHQHEAGKAGPPRPSAHDSAASVVRPCLFRKGDFLLYYYCHIISIT